MTGQKYIAAFPNYCRKCKGSGVHSALTPKVMLWDCECVLADPCARCGASPLGDLRVCPVCRWHMDENERGLLRLSSFNQSSAVRRDSTKLTPNLHQGAFETYTKRMIRDK